MAYIVLPEMLHYVKLRVQPSSRLFSDKQQEGRYNFVQYAGCDKVPRPPCVIGSLVQALSASLLYGDLTHKVCFCSAKCVCFVRYFFCNKAATSISFPVLVSLLYLSAAPCVSFCAVELFSWLTPVSLRYHFYLLTCRKTRSAERRKMTLKN
jgi:hypothetical protein